MILAVIGFALVLASVFGSYFLAGGNVAIILHALPIEMSIICGAAAGAFLVSNRTGVVKAAGRGLVRALRGSRWTPDNFRDLLVLLFLIADKMKREGAMSLEADVERPSESVLFNSFPKLLADRHLIEFLCDHVRMATIEDLDVRTAMEAMDADLERHHQEEHEPQRALQTLADGLPAIGIVAAVLGVIKTMGSIDQPTEVLGAMIGGALVGTFLGVLLSYCFVGPLAHRLGQVIEQDSKPYLLARSVLLASVGGTVPQVSVEIARRLTPSTSAPTFAELEEAVRSARNAKAA
jgi:chemotaxis protein MotA